MSVLVFVLKTVLYVTAGLTGAALYQVWQARKEEPLRDLPPEIRAQLEGCRNCNLSQLVCDAHPRRPFESCGCGALPVPCPVCRAECWDVVELLERIERLKAGQSW